MIVVAEAYERATGAQLGSVRVEGGQVFFFGPDGQPDEGDPFVSFIHHWRATHPKYRGPHAYADLVRDALLNSPPVYGPLRFLVHLVR